MSGIQEITLATLLGLLLLGCGGQVSSEPLAPVTFDVAANTNAPPAAAPLPAPIKVEVAVMSQCPYAAKALNALIPVVRDLGPQVELELTHVGRNEGGALTSMHGPSEVVGDALQLCARRQGDREQWLGFLQCLSDTYRQIPGSWQACAEASQLDQGAMCRCVEGGEGEELLRASFAASERAGVTASPTFFLGDERYQAGRSQQAFARAICQRLSPETPYCRDLPPPTPVPIVLLTDGRCVHPDCDTGHQVAALKMKIPGARISELDYASERGRELFEISGVKRLPAFLIGSEIQQDQDAFRSIARSAKHQGDMFVQALGRFDPTKGEWLERPVVPVRLLVDGRCKTRECEGIGRFEQFIRRQVPRAIISRIDYGDGGEGRALWKAIVASQSDGGDAERPPRPLGLPLALFGRAIEQEEETYSRLERRFVTVGDEYLFQLGPWDPTAEICDNGADDDGDRRVDCRDPDCREQLACRPEKAGELRLFVMSQCPYSLKVIDEMASVLDHFGGDRRGLDFRLDFVGQVDAEGELSSMHGPEEVAEDLREICAQHHYGEGYAFMDYVFCRGRDIRSTEWTQCVSPPLEVEVIRRCAEGDEGRQLLRRSFELAQAVGFRGTPSWLMNNRYVIEGRSAPDIVADICRHLQRPECSQPVQPVEAGPSLPREDGQQAEGHQPPPSAEPSPPQGGRASGLPPLPGCQGP